MIFKRKPRAERVADEVLLAVQRDLATPFYTPLAPLTRERLPRFRVVYVDRTAEVGSGKERMVVTLDRVL
jgi:hypothetical protein